MADPIQHVIALMLENHSFDQMVGRLKAVYPQLMGVDENALHSNPDYPDTNPPIFQAPTQTRETNPDPSHDTPDVLRQLDGGNSGFVRDYVQSHPSPVLTSAQRKEVMGYYPLGFLPALHELGQNFAVCDHWFSSVPGPTWTNRFFAMSGTSLGRVNMPSGVFDPNWHLYDQTTVFDRLGEAGKSWKVYYGDFPHSLLLTHQWLHPFNYAHMDAFFADAAGDPAKFPAFAWMEPTYFHAGENDAHPPTDIMRADVLLASIYNAIRANDALWKSTLFLVYFDEHGGFYDQLPPPAAVPPDGHKEEYTFDRLGLRVPAILVSPWSEKGVVRSVFDHTSLLKYLQEKWGLGDLGKRTASANSFGAELQRLSAPREDTPASVPVFNLAPAAPVAHVAGPAPASATAPPSLNEFQQSLVSFSHYLETQMHSSDSEIARRSLRVVGGPDAQAQVAMERVERFLASRKAKPGP